MSSEGKGRLARWSQRKAEVGRRRGAAAPTIPEEPGDVPATRVEPPEEARSAPQTAEQPAREPDLPDVESLTAESDFTAFMKEGVPAGLRRLALRKLWASDPMFNIIDEMVEYGEDYTDAATVVAGMNSAWEAGRGYTRKTVESEPDDKVAPDDAQDREADAVAGEQTAPDDDQNEGGPRESG